MRTTHPVLGIGGRDLVVVPGVRGAGKSRLLQRVRIRGRARVLDPEQVAAVVARLVGTTPHPAPRTEAAVEAARPAAGRTR